MRLSAPSRHRAVVRSSASCTGFEDVPWRRSLFRDGHSGVARHLFDAGSPGPSPRPRPHGIGRRSRCRRSRSATPGTPPEDHRPSARGAGGHPESAGSAGWPRRPDARRRRSWGAGTPSGVAGPGSPEGRTLLVAFRGGRLVLGSPASQRSTSSAVACSPVSRNSSQASTVSRRKASRFSSRSTYCAMASRMIQWDVRLRVSARCWTRSFMLSSSLMDVGEAIRCSG